MIQNNCNHNPARRCGESQSPLRARAGLKGGLGMKYEFCWIEVFGALIAFLICFSVLSACEAATAKPAEFEIGVCSYYGAGEKLNDGVAYRGLQFDERLMECASYAYPLGTVLRVTNVANGKSIIVRVTDRGPHPRLNRIVDLTAHAFSQIADLSEGLIDVKVEQEATYNQRWKR